MAVRPERPDDYEAIARVVEAAFGGSYEVRMVELIRASEQYVPELALVAEEDGEIIGHAMSSYVALRGEKDLNVLELAPVAVAPTHQRRGIGGALVEAGIEGAQARSEPLVLVLGHPEYYPRFGFVPASRHGIEPPSPDIRDAAFMVRLLPAYDERYRGRVVFPPAFDVT